MPPLHLYKSLPYLEGLSALLPWTLDPCQEVLVQVLITRSPVWLKPLTSLGLHSSLPRPSITGHDSGYGPGHITIVVMMLHHRQGGGPRGAVVGTTRMLSLLLSLLPCGGGMAQGTLPSCKGGTAHCHLSCHHPSHITPFLSHGVAGSPRMWWWRGGGINMASSSLSSLLWYGGRRNDSKEGVCCISNCGHMTHYVLAQTMQKNF